MEKEEKKVVICMPTREAKLGGAADYCTDCDTEVRITPGTLKQIDSTEFEPICLQCAFKRGILKEGIVERPSVEQIKELIDYVKQQRRASAQN